MYTISFLEFAKIVRKKNLPFVSAWHIITHVILLLIIFSMKNIVKWALAVSVAAHMQLVSAIDVRVNSTGVEQLEWGGTGNLAQTISNAIGFLVGFLYLIAVIYGIYGGFLILTAAGDEERVKKGKTTLIHAVLGIIVIFLASTVIRFVIDAMSGQNLVA